MCAPVRHRRGNLPLHVLCDDPNGVQVRELCICERGWGQGSARGRQAGRQAGTQDRGLDQQVGECQSLTLHLPIHLAPSPPTLPEALMPSSSPFPLSPFPNTPPLNCTLPKILAAFHPSPSFSNMRAWAGGGSQCTAERSAPHVVDARQQGPSASGCAVLPLLVLQLVPVCPFGADKHHVKLFATKETHCKATA